MAAGAQLREQMCQSLSWLFYWPAALHWMSCDWLSISKTSGRYWSPMSFTVASLCHKALTLTPPGPIFLLFTNRNTTTLTHLSVCMPSTCSCPCEPKDPRTCSPFSLYFSLSPPLVSTLPLCLLSYWFGHTRRESAVVLWKCYLCR